MWYQTNSGAVYYIDDCDTVWRVWDDSLVAPNNSNADIVANMCQRINPPDYAVAALRNIDKYNSV